MNLRLIFLVTTFFDIGLSSNLRRFDKTTYMSEDVWNEKKFDFSTKTSLITCVAYCTSWSGTGSGKNCNAVSYDKGMVFCYQNCSDLLSEKIVLVVQKKLLKFEAES